jgi:hypothetical protein
VLFRVEVVGSTPADPTTGRTGPAATKIFRKLWELKKEGQCRCTMGYLVFHNSRQVSGEFLIEGRFEDWWSAAVKSRTVDEF